MGDPDVARLYTGERRNLSRSAARIVGADDAEDVVHDAFVAYLSCAAEARRPEAWLQRTVRNRALNHVRGDEPLPLYEVPDERASPERDIERRVLRDVIVRALEALPERSARALVLRHFEGEGYGEVASALGVRVSHAHLIVHRAKRRLAREIVRQLAEAMGTSGCAPALQAMAGLDDEPTDHDPGPCDECRPVWEELLSLRGLRALWPAGPFLERALDPVRLRMVELGEPVGRAAAALALSATLVLPPGSGPSVGEAGPADVAPQAPVAEHVAQEEPDEAPEESATTPGPDTGTPDDPPPSEPPAEPAAEGPEEVASAGGASVSEDDDHTQAEADPPDDGEGGRTGVVVCEPLEPCPPPAEGGDE